jgi:hypothetical protein
MGNMIKYLEAGTLTAEGANGSATPTGASAQPVAAHGFLFQHAEEFAGDVLEFLDS